MTKVPAAVWVVDTKKEHIAVDEARKLGIPVIAVLDTNCDPDEVDFPIPGNDDAIRSAELLTRVVADAVADGLIARSGTALAAAPRRSRSRAPSPPTSRCPSGSASCSRAPTKARRASRGRQPADRAGQPASGRPSRPSRREYRSRRPVRPDRYERERVMANFTAADVKKLRDLTGAGMMDCKKALDEADGDFDKAVEILRIKGAKDVGKRAGRTAANGLVAHSGNGAARAQLRDRLRRQERRLRRAGPAAGRARRRAAKPADVDALLAADAGRRPTVADAIAGARPPRSARSSCSTGSRCSTAPSRSTCTARARTCRRRSACWSQYTGKTDEAGDADARGVAMQIAAMRPKYLTRDEVPGRGRRVRAAHRRGDRPRGGQAGGGAAQDRRGPGQRASSRTSSCSSRRRWRTTRRRCKQVLDGGRHRR